MTTHFHFKHANCQKCSAIFVPFKKNFKCPNCGEPVEEFFDFIPKLVQSMKNHKERYGYFTPPVWYVGSLVEHIQRIVFDIFDNVERKSPRRPREFITKILKNADWQDSPYLKRHVKDIVFAVYDVYRTDDYFLKVKSRNTKKGRQK